MVMQIDKMITKFCHSFDQNIFIELLCRHLPRSYPYFYLDNELFYITFQKKSIRCLLFSLDANFKFGSCRATYVFFSFALPYRQA